MQIWHFPAGQLWLHFGLNLAHGPEFDTCAVDEQQNPLHRTKMLFEGDRNSTGGRNGVFPNSKGLRFPIQHCMKGEGGLQMSFLQLKQDGVDNS